MRKVRRRNNDGTNAIGNAMSLRQREGAFLHRRAADKVAI